MNFNRLSTALLFTCLALPGMASAGDGWAFGPWDRIDESTNAVTLEELMASPGRHLERVVRFDCRYHKGESIFNPTYTGLSKSEFAAFSAWGLEAVLFREEDYARDLPFFYVDRDSDAMEALGKLDKYDQIEVVGRVKSVYQNRPWIVVSAIRKARFSSKVTQSTLRRARVALKLFDEGSYSAAAAEFLEVVDRPMDEAMKAQISSYAGRALLSSGKAEEAVDYLESSWKVRESSDAGLWLGRALLASGQWSQAVSVLEDVVDQYPTKSSVRLVLSEAYAREREVKKCLDAARSSLSLEPGQAEAYKIMGAALAASGLDSEAIEVYREGLEKASAGAGTFHWALGRLHYQRQEYAWAVNELELAKRAFPGNAEIHIATARALRDRGDRWHRAASVNFDRAFELNPELVDERLEQAVMLHGDGEPAEALAAVTPYLAKRPDDLRALVIAGISAEHIGQFVVARAHFEKAEALDGPGHHSRHLGFVLEALGEDGAAADAYERAAKTGLDKEARFECAFLSATLRLKHDNVDGALAMAALAVQLKPSHAYAALNYGRCLVVTGRPAAAVKHLEWSLAEVEPAERRLASTYLVLATLQTGVVENRQLELSAELIAADSKDELVRLVRGWALARHGNPAASEILRSLVRTRPQARIGMLELLITQGRLADARRVLDELETVREGGSGPLGDLLDDLEDRLEDLEDAERS